MADKRAREDPSPSGKGDASDWETTQELLQQIKEGDQSALNRLYGRYRPQLKSLLTHMGELESQSSTTATIVTRHSIQPDLNDPMAAPIQGIGELHQARVSVRENFSLE